MQKHHKLLAVLAASIIALGLVGCSDNGEATTPKKSDLMPRLEKAKSALDGAETVKVSLSTAKLPDGVTGLLSATGTGNHSPAFTGKAQVVAGGASLGADIISVDKVVYFKTGFSPKFSELDPSTIGAPDPARLIATSGGISDLLVNTTKLAAGKKSRDGKEVLTTINGALPGTVVRSLIPTADATKNFDVTYRLTAGDELRDARIEGPFYGTKVVAYSLKVSTSDQPVTITAP